LIPYRAMLDVPAELLRYLTRLLAAERRRRGTPARSRKLTCRDQALLALRWFRDRTRPGRLAARAAFSNVVPPAPSSTCSACRCAAADSTAENDRKHPTYEALLWDLPGA